MSIFIFFNVLTNAYLTLKENEMATHCIALADLKLMILLPQHP
jgi:hypothetical protein